MTTPSHDTDPATGTASPHRFPARLFRCGSEPDPRFTLANERTFLAWIRTALALIAAGVALEALGLDLHPELRLSASLLLIVAGLLTPLQAWAGWYGTERALRRSRPLPAPILALPTAVAVLAAGVLVVLGVLFR
ncbi:DUF202 domain-containing protein [Pseudonocardia nematodicida]|uniref:DUF202 domain-containing protein n=1 Tax=Pseudonocardia nematodicida TaxID=1206997 RepID=A0ABV1KKZ4_9PSEU